MPERYRVSRDVTTAFALLWGAVVIGCSSTQGNPSQNGSGEGGSQALLSESAPEWPPTACIGNIVEATVGAYCLGPEVGSVQSAAVSSDSAVSASGCGSILWGIVRDFRTYDVEVANTSKDFGGYCCGAVKGMVGSELAGDGKPTYTGVGASSGMMTSEADFSFWYNDAANVNIPYHVAFRLDDAGGGISTFSAANSTMQYFPLDDLDDGKTIGWGNDVDSAHNYSFTTEIHTRFRYQGGEIFSFTGDDDLWVFINGRLAIDIGGVHTALTASVNLDEWTGDLGLIVGNEYAMDLFGAERHPGDSNFRVETSMNFVDCGTAPVVF